MDHSLAHSLALIVRSYCQGEGIRRDERKHYFWYAFLNNLLHLPSEFITMEKKNAHMYHVRQIWKNLNLLHNLTYLFLSNDGMNITHVCGLLFSIVNYSCKTMFLTSPRQILLIYMNLKRLEGKNLHKKSFVGCSAQRTYLVGVKQPFF